LFVSKDKGCKGKGATVPNVLRDGARLMITDDKGNAMDMQSGVVIAGW
tara:strand:+ start:119 stop:262 length:144 start_codon:yes stop_codon:yes gene_type:complete